MFIIGKRTDFVKPFVYASCTYHLVSSPRPIPRTPFDASGKEWLLVMRLFTTEECTSMEQMYRQTKVNK